MKLNLDVIIVTYNSAQNIARCLSQLIGRSSNLAYDIYVVDNRSRDNTIEIVQTKFPDIHLIKNDRNVGFAAACNLVLRKSIACYSLLLNPDVEINPEQLQSWVTFMDQHSEIGICGCRLKNSDLSLQTSCRRFPTLWAIFLRASGLSRVFPRDRRLRDYLMLDWDHIEPHEVDWVLGGCLLVRKEAYEQVGLLDDWFFLYYEDIDWCYRMKLASWKVYYFPEVEAMHEHQRASARGIMNRARWEHLRSLVRLFLKHRFPVL